MPSNGKERTRRRLQLSFPMNAHIFPHFLSTELTYSLLRANAKTSNESFRLFSSGTMTRRKEKSSPVSILIPLSNRFSSIRLQYQRRIFQRWKSYKFFASYSSCWNRAKLPSGSDEARMRSLKVHFQSHSFVCQKK